MAEYTPIGALIGGEAIAQTEILRDETQALRDEAAAFGGTNNSQVATFVTAPGPARNAVTSLVNDTVEPLLANAGLNVVYFEGDPLYPRPDTTSAVLWVGEVDPINRIAGDIVFIASALPEPGTLDDLSGLVARWRADDLTLIGAPVASLPSRAGSSGVALTQATGSSQPILLESTEFGGRKVLRFAASSSQFMTYVLDSLPMPYTVFAVYKLSNANARVYSGQTTGNYGGLGNDSAGTLLRINTAGSPQNGVTSPYSITSGPRIAAAVYQSADARLYNHSLTAVSGSLAGLATTGVMSTQYVGRGPGGNYGNLDLAELIIVSGNMAHDDVVNVIGELANRYGLVVT